MKANWAIVAEGGVLRLQVFPRAGGANPQNEAYAESLSLLVQRLAAISATLVAAYVDTSRVRDLPMHKRLITLVSVTYPVALSPSIDADKFRRMLQKGQTRVGQSEGSRGGNNTRGMFLHIQIANWSCERVADYLETGVDSFTQRG